MIWFDEGPSLGMSQAEADAPDIPRCHDANRNENINAMQAPVFLMSSRHHKCQARTNCDAVTGDCLNELLALHTGIVSLAAGSLFSFRNWRTTMIDDSYESTIWHTI